MTKVVVTGASGRMGSRIVEVVQSMPGFELLAGLTSKDDLTVIKQADLVLDATNIESSTEIVAFATANGVSVLVASSGWNAEKIKQLSETIDGKLSVGVAIIPNFAIGSVLGSYLATKAAEFYDSIEIIEAHHDKKVDSPSGTAVRTAELVAAAHGSALTAPSADGPGRGVVIAGVPVHSLRMQGILARQQVIFGGSGEQLTIVHDTLSPDAYDKGIALALAAMQGKTGVIVGLDQLLGWS